MNNYPAEFIEAVTLEFKKAPHGGQVAGMFEAPLAASIEGIKIEVERSRGARNQLKQRNIAMAGLFAAWNKLKEQSGE